MTHPRNVVTTDAVVLTP